MFPTPQTILCVEDDEDTCSMVELLLTHAGYDVSSAATIEKGLAEAQNRTFSLYILDTKLPDGDGVDLCHEIRRFDRETPILFFSAEAREAERVKALGCGAQEYLVKPDDVFHLVEKVSRLVGARPAA